MQMILLGDDGVKDAKDYAVMVEDSNWFLRRHAESKGGDLVDLFESNGLEKHGPVEVELVGPNDVVLETQRVGKGSCSGLMAYSG